MVQRFFLVVLVVLSTGIGSAAGQPTAQPTVPVCLGERATSVGTPGNDLLTGTTGRDVIVGL